MLQLQRERANSDAKNGCVILKRVGKAQKQPLTLAVAVCATLKRKLCKANSQTLGTRGKKKKVSSLKESSLIDLNVVRFTDIEHKLEKQKKLFLREVILAELEIARNNFCK